MSVIRRALGGMRSLAGAALEGSREYERQGAAMSDLLARATAGTSVGLLLDVGCGVGGYTRQHAQTIGVPLDRVVGLDYHPDHVAAARKHFRVELVDLETDRFPLDDGSISVVVCNQVLEHIKNIFFLLSEMDRVLATGGVLAIGVPNLTSLLNRPFLLLGRQPVTVDIAGPHVRGFAHRSLREFLLRHDGYRLVSERGSSLYPWPTRLGAEHLARWLPGLSAYSLLALKKLRSVQPCPWLNFAVDGETSYAHSPIASGPDTIPDHGTGEPNDEPVQDLA